MNVTEYNSYLKKKKYIKGIDLKKSKGIFQGDGNVMYLDCG